jgi:hypothetical protein
MSLSLEQIRVFQEKELESRNDANKTATPIPGYVVEWCLIEIVVLLTEIRNKVAGKFA